MTPQTDQELIASLTDEEALTLTLFGEARGEPLEGKAAVASVILNRVKNPERYADTIRDVCLQPKQFSCWNPGSDANHAKLMAMAERLQANQVGTDADGLALAECRYVALGYIGKVLRSRIGDADHYLTRALWSSSARPSWAETNTSAQFVGSQVFLRVA